MTQLWEFFRILHNSPNFRLTYLVSIIPHKAPLTVCLRCMRFVILCLRFRCRLLLFLRVLWRRWLAWVVDPNFFEIENSLICSRKLWSTGQFSSSCFTGTLMIDNEAPFEDVGSTSSFSAAASTGQLWLLRDNETMAAQINIFDIIFMKKMMKKSHCCRFEIKFLGILSTKAQFCNLSYSSMRNEYLSSPLW